MPEGHTVHRIALQFTKDFVGRPIRASSPQGRFAAGAARIDRAVMTAAYAVGKQLFCEFDTGDPGTGRPESNRVADLEPAVLRVHLGMYGAWDFFGAISPITADSAAVGSMGAPRLRRGVRMGEGEREVPVGAAPAGGGSPEVFPPEPVGQVRVRLATARSAADLRGPTACELLDPQQAKAVIARLGPDPMIDPGPDAERAFIAAASRRSVAIGQLLMDQSVVSGIGNIFRAELLFRAGLSPHRPGRAVPAGVLSGLWRDWAALLRLGVQTGVMLTRGRPGEPLDDATRALSLAEPAERHWVYGRAGLPCRACGTPIAMQLMAGRKLYWCPACQPK